jgi:uncharacterized membrane protein
MRFRSLSALVVLLLFAALLRIYDIDAQSIWADEGFTYLITQEHDILPMLRSDVHPPLYFLSMKVWASAAGTSELALRLPSALASVVTVALVYLLGRDLVRWRGDHPDVSSVPFIAALVIALSDLEIDLSHEARMYTIHTALAVLCMLAYVRWSRRPRSAYLWLLGLSSTLLIYVNYLGVWTPLVIGLHALIFLRGRQLITVIGTLAASAVAVLPWLLLVGPDQIDNGAGADRADANTIETLRIYRDNWLGQQWPLMLGLLALGTVVLDYGERVRVRLKPYRVSALLMLWLIVPLALTIIANIWIPVLAAHRVSQITPAVCLLIAFGLGNLRQPARGFLIAVIAVSALTTVDFYRIKGPWESYTQTVTPFVQPDDLVLMEIGGGDTMLEYYFDRDLPENTQVVSLKRWREGMPDDFYAGILPLLVEYETVWLLHWSSETAIFEWLQRTGYVETMHRVTQHIQDSRLDTYRFDRMQEEEIGQLGSLKLKHAEIDLDKLRVDLIWTTDQRIEEPLVTSAYILDAAGFIAAQHDSQPMLNERPTTAWRPGETIFDPKLLQTSDGRPLTLGIYSIGVVAYRFLPDGSTQRLLTPDGADYISLGSITFAP